MTGRDGDEPTRGEEGGQDSDTAGGRERPVCLSLPSVPPLGGTTGVDKRGERASILALSDDEDGPLCTTVRVTVCGDREDRGCSAPSEDDVSCSVGMLFKTIVDTMS